MRIRIVGIEIGLKGNKIRIRMDIETEIEIRIEMGII